MNRPRIKTVWGAISLLIVVFSLSSISLASGEEIPFDEEHWNFINARKVQHLGREALIGYAMLKDVEFTDGTIEVDLAVTGERAYAGFVFRLQGMGDYEHFYVRSHRNGLYGDDLQYAPVTNGISSWQLYSGPGYSSSWKVPAGRWFHVKMEVKGRMAKVYMDGAEEPSLVIEDLQHGEVAGAIGLQGQMNGTAYFSGFSYTKGGDLQFDPPAERHTEPGFINEWKVSRVFRISDVDIDDRFDEKDIDRIEWKDVSADWRGMVDLSKTYSRTGREPDCIFAKAAIDSKKKESREYKFGYSDYVAIFLNGDLLFTGSSAYRQRDPSFAGIIGLHDVINLPLKKGRNEIVLMVAESFGGWGFMFQDAEATFMAGEVKREWELDDGFRIPESILYDRDSGAVYVSNYDQYNYRNPQVRQSISKLTPEGEVVKMDWAAGLVNPTGLAVSGGKMFAVERTGVAEIDLASGEVLGRNPIPSAVFPNDIAIDEAGNIYVSDTNRNVIFRYDGSMWTEWLTAPDISAPNAIMVDGDRLYIGNNGENMLVAADLATGKLSSVADLGVGNIDGITIERDGILLVSHWEGRLMRVTTDGEVTELLDTRTPGEYCADFAYIPEKKLVIAPTFFDNKVVAYRIGNQKG